MNRSQVLKFLRDNRGFTAYGAEIEFDLMTESEGIMAVYPAHIIRNYFC